MKTALRSAVSSTVYWTQCLLGHKDTGTRILTYHRVNDEERDYLSVPISNFRSQMKFLAEAGMRVISLKEFIQKGPQKNTVALTFDDGYRDNYINAFPILKEFEFPASIFCVSDRIGEESYLKEAEIQEMLRAGIDFGSHTLSHPHLCALKKDQKQREIAQSKQTLEKRIGISPQFFCYPYGEYDSEAIRLVKESGYAGACTNDPGSNQEVNAFTLKRTEISGSDSLEDFRKKLAGAYDLVHKSLHWMRGRA